MQDDPWHVKALVLALAILIFTIAVMLWWGIFEFFGWMFG